MSNDFVILDEGAEYLAAHGNGLPATCYFLLSEKPANGYVSSSYLSGGLLEISLQAPCTGYARKSQAAPTPVGNLVTFASMTWNTGLATDWSKNVQSLVLATTPDDSGKAICAWDLVPSLQPGSLSPVSIVSSGGSGAAGVYYWLLIAQNATGAQASGAAYSTYVPANGKITLSWSPVAGASAYQLHRAASSSDLFNTDSRVSGATASPYTDDPGVATIAPPAQTLNTTNGFLDMSTAGYSLTITPTFTTED